MSDRATTGRAGVGRAEPAGVARAGPASVGGPGRRRAADARAPRGRRRVSPESLAPLFRVLGDPTRLRILEALLERERTVSELVELLGIPQSRVSNHLACLKWCRMVEAERRGRTVTYRIADSRLAALLPHARELAAEHAEYLARCTRIGPDWV